MVRTQPVSIKTGFVYAPIKCLVKEGCNGLLLTFALEKASSNVK